MTSYKVLEEFETTSGTVWQKREYASGVIRYRNSDDFRKNQGKRSWAAAHKHKVETQNIQVGPERRDEEIFDDQFHHRTIQPTKFYGDYITRMEEWHQNEPEIEIINFGGPFLDDILEELSTKLEKQGPQEPGWPDKFDRYHFYIKYLVIREGEPADTSRRYTQAAGGEPGDFDVVDELVQNFRGIVNELKDVAGGYENVVVIEWGIQAKQFNGAR